MPTGKGNGTENGAKRETFRPPWVKDGPDSTPPKPSNLWAKNRQSTIRDGDQPTEGKKPPLSKANSQQAQENGTNKENTFVKPQLKPVPPKEPKPQPKEVNKIPIKLNSVKAEGNSDIKKPPFVRQPTKESAPSQELDREPAKTRTDLVRQDSINKMMPKAPPMPPPAPAMPRPPDLRPLSNTQKQQIENLKSRPKVRPDWSGLLKEVERGKKLNHVQCNDRSKPLLVTSVVKDQDKGQFLFESEKDNKENSHNQLIEEIQKGVALRKVKTNDRSKPMLEGLRKFRRQMTIEEQIVKSMSMASIPQDEIVTDEADELDDIDKVRDDLQSTKQLLAIEMRNKEAQMRENRRLQARILQLEAEVDKSKKAPTTAAAAPAGPTEAEEKLLKSLKSEAADARKIAKDLEEKYHSAADQLDHTKSELEEIRRQKLQLEEKLKETLQGGKRQSIVSSRKDSFLGHDPTTEEEDSESDEDSGGSDNEEKQEKRTQRELKLLQNKLRSYKNKVDNARKERIALKNLIKKYQEAMKDEKKKHKLLQKEVDKMAAMMKDEDDEDEEEPEEEESESESESSESESSESEQSESEKSASESEDAPIEKKKLNLTTRQKKHENRLTALKKGNFILKTNAERLQDDLNKQKDDTAALQQDLDSVLSELG